VNRLLILSRDASKYLALIDAADLPQLAIDAASDVTPAKAKLAACNIILGDPGLVSEVAGSIPELEWVQSTWAGVNSLCAEGLRRDYILTGVKGVFGPLMSEYVITYLFALERQVFTMRSNQMKQRWQPLPYKHSGDITLGVVGLGSIGRHLARTAGQFGIRVLGLNRTGDQCVDVEKVYTIENSADFFAESDYVVLTLPETKETRNFIDAEKLGMMKPSSVLMNVGRGSTINEADLVRALRDGVIGGAVLDVFVDEPLAQDSPLWKLPNVFVTPHRAAISFPRDIAGIFIENYRRFLGREPLLHVVNFESGY
jgi:phosphoglycerate dehydrogenase-like enzyme